MPVFTSEGRAVGVGSDENAAPCLPLTRASKTSPIAHTAAPFAKVRVFLSCGYYHTRKKPFLQKAKKPFSNPNQIRCKRFGDHGKKGASRFYKVRVLGHFGKKGARCRDQPYGGGFFGRWRSSDLHAAKKATPYSL